MKCRREQGRVFIYRHSLDKARLRPLSPEVYHVQPHRLKLRRQLGRLENEIGRSGAMLQGMYVGMYLGELHGNKGTLEIPTLTKLIGAWAVGFSLLAMYPSDHHSQADYTLSTTSGSETLYDILIYYVCLFLETPELRNSEFFHVVMRIYSY